MPLQQELPVIDDRTYEEIRDEARSRIPRYAPEWTDVNESDPGMIMVELFAWLTEMQLFRMSKVPQLNYLKFLELVGIELEPAKAATARITFPVLDSFGEASCDVPLRTQVTTEDPDDEGPIIFETDRSLIAIKAKLDRMQTYDGSAYRDISNENNDTEVTFEPFDSRVREGSALLLGFDSELPATTVSLTFWVPSDENSASGLQCCGKDQQIFVSSELTWEYWNGREWKRLDILKDETAALTRTGEIDLVGPKTGELVADAIGNVEDDRYWIRARVSEADYDAAPRLLAVRTNTITATQAESLEFETLGGSNGQVDQVLSVSDAPVLDGSLQLEVDEGTGFEAWTEVTDLFGSGEQDTHFVLNRATGEVQFGDGVNGRIPVANPRLPANIRAREYRVGGGQRGNVKAGKLVVLQSSVEGVDAGNVTNLLAAAGGADEESLDDARMRAPQTLKSRNRAVTEGDFEELAIRSTNIARAKALPLHHPDFPDLEVPGVVTVVVVPDVDTEENPTPVPSRGTIETVCAYLDDRRLLTAELYVIGPTYQEVKIKAELIAEDDADLGTVKSDILEAITRYFDPLEGGEDSSEDEPGTGWPFGGDIYYSLLYRRLLLDGVKRIAALTITLDGDEYDPCTDVTVEAGVLLSNGEHEIEVLYE